MQKLILRIVFFLFTFPSIGQITLTNSSAIPSPGDSYTFVINSTSGFDFSQNGSNQSWDFSAVTGATVPKSFVGPSASSEPFTYPSATIVQDISPYAEIYYSSTASDFSTEGYILPGLLRTIYTNKRELLRFPITYNSNFNDSFSGTSEDLILNITYDLTGSIEIVADAYGELILPYGTINNVLRIRTVTNYDESYLGNPISNFVDTVYSWYNAFTKVPLASQSVSYENGGQVSYQIEYISENDLVLKLENKGELTHLNCTYPNPTSGKTNVPGLNSMTTVTVFNLMGEIETSKITDGPLDLTNLPKGSYYLQYSKNGVIRTVKLIKN